MKISPQVEWLVLECVKIIGLDIAGVDLLIDKNTYKICEVNSSPGFEGLEKALGECMVVNVEGRGCGGGRSAEGDMDGAGGGEVAGVDALLALAVSSASVPLVLEDISLSN